MIVQVFIQWHSTWPGQSKKGKAQARVGNVNIK